jgi:rubrerythrin
MFQAEEILDLAIRLEKNGEATYRKAIQSSTDEELKALLTWMAEEEARHGNWFAELKAALSTGRKNPFLEKIGHQLLADTIGGQSFSLNEVDFSKVSGPVELVSIFIEFEKDTVLFYEMVAPFIESGEARTQLQAIIAEENRHIARLKEFMEKGEEVLVSAR